MSMKLKRLKVKAWLVVSRFAPERGEGAGRRKVWDAAAGPFFTIVEGLDAKQTVLDRMRHFNKVEVLLVEVEWSATEVA